MQNLLSALRACTLCAGQLEPRPVVQAHPRACIAIIGQAPGRLVHETGIPWNDPSGRRLREWLQVSEEQFYNEQLFALIPMAFCYPGTVNGGDLPPPPICSQTWHQQLLDNMTQLDLILLIGQYAQKYYLSTKQNLTETVRAWQQLDKRYLPLPHPSPRNRRWFKQNPWFEVELLPELRERVAAYLYGTDEV